MTLKAFALGRMEGGRVRLLGTAFFVRKDTFATAAHVLEGNDANLFAIVPEQFNNDLNQYQKYPRDDLSILSVAVADIDPLHDLAVLKCLEGSAANHFAVPQFESSDSAVVGDDVFSLSYPHSALGNTIMVVQVAIVSARVLVKKGSIGIKHLVINQQTVLGQSGAPVYAKKSGKILGILVGAFGIGAGSGISLGGIDPQTLHQTSFAVSAEYLTPMLG
jgi:hypothetical protein